MTSSVPLSASELERLFPGNSELATRMRTLDWSQTDLGSPEQWTENLRVAVSLCLTSRIPIVMYWGRNFTVLYNDAYISFLGESKHPRYLGQPGRECWREIWETIEPMLESVYATGNATLSEDVRMFFARRLPLEEVYVRFTFGPILASDGKTVQGIFCPCTETTEQVVGARRLETHRKLGLRIAETQTVPEACQKAAEVLSENPQDIPFASVYLVDETGTHATISASVGLAKQECLLPRSVSCTDEDASALPLASVLRTQRPTECLETDQSLGSHSNQTCQAIVLPISATTTEKLAGLLVVGISPHCVFNAAYRTFFDLAAGYIGTAIASAREYEAERKRAETLAELDRAKTVFFSNVSHEFRTPLTLMLSPLEEMVSTSANSFSPADHERLKLIHRNGLRLLKLVNTLLDFSRIEAGRIQATYAPTDLAMLTADLAGVFRSAIEQAGMRLIVNCAPLSEPAYVDREMWEKIVLNLLSNAFKFTFAGEITVSLREAASANASVQPPSIELEVRDTGTGIPADELPHIFKRFHRVHDAKGRTFEGSGIGLSLVQELVHLHGGEIAVSSGIDQGTCFTVTIPSGYAHLPSDRLRLDATSASSTFHSRTSATPYVEETLHWLPSDIKPSVVIPPAAEPLSTSTARILLADDNADMRDYVQRLLSQHYDIETVADGRAALSAIRHRRPDLVLSDVMMPGLDGFGLLRSLRSDPLTQEIPIILLSARAGEESRIEGLEAGADDYLTKPFSARELLARVEATLKLARLRREVNTDIQRSEARSRLAIRIAQLGTWRYDPTTRLVELDERMREIWGESEDAAVLPLSRIVEQIHPDDRDRVSNAVRLALDPKSSGIYDIDYRIVWRDGTERWISANGQTEFAGEGESRQAVELIGTVLDISDRKRTEIALRESQGLFEAFMQHSPATAFIKDEAGRYLYVNPQSEQICDRSSEDLLGKTDFELAPIAEAQQWRNHDLAALSAGQAIEIAETQTQADGEHHFISYKFPIPLNSGRQLLGGMSLDVTERRRASIALQESEERLRLALEGADLGMWFWDAESNQLTWTDRAKAMFGLPIDTEVSMQVFLEAVHPDDRPYVQAIATDLQIGPVHVEGEYRSRWADGTIRWILARGNSSYDANGRLLATRGILMDITERKQIEETLRQRETELRLVTDAVPALISFVDSDQRYRFNSQEYEEWFGHKATEIYGKHIRTVLGEAAYEEIHPYVERVLAGEPVNFETQLAYKDGAPRYVDATYVPRFNSQGVVEGFVAMITDISDRKRTEQSLHESLAILNTINDATPILIYMKDRQGRLRMANPATLNCLGKAESELIGKSELEFYLNPEEAKPIVENDRQVMETGQSQMFEETMQLPQGTHTFLSIKAPYRDMQGRVIGLIGVSTEITDRKRAETEREQLLAREQAARAEAEQANRLKDEFLAIVSHELRSPLNPILGWSTLLQTQKLNPVKTAQALDTIARNAKLQAELIEDLLDISRILRGKLSLNIHPTDLASTIHAAMETVQLAAEAKSIHIQTQLQTDIGLVSGDSSRLQQVVWNLLSNAIKFTPPTGQVSIQLKRFGSDAQITVRDTGRGIHPDFLPHVFDYFRQEDGATTRKFGGLGLGLAIVYHLVELHGGTVQAESLGEGQGATFVVRLPIMHTSPQVIEDSGAGVRSLDLTNIRVLVVDDDTDTREFIAFLIEQRGANVMAVGSANQAIAVLPRFKPDVLISDIGMPEVDGYMLMKQVKALLAKQGKQIPAIALTAYAGEINQQQALSAGFQQHVAKPVEPEKLINILVGVVEKTRSVPNA